MAKFDPASCMEMPILHKAQIRDLQSQLEEEGEVLSGELVLLHKLQVLLDLNYDSIYLFRVYFSSLDVV